MPVRLTNEDARRLFKTRPSGKRQARVASNTDKAQGRNLAFDKLCEAHGLPVPVHEYQFHPTRKWKFDYLFGDNVALEVEGGLFGVGQPCPTCKRRAVAGHSSIERIKRDMEKYNAAAVLGYVILRCLPEDIESGAAFALVISALEGNP